VAELAPRPTTSAQERFDALVAEERQMRWRPAEVGICAADGTVLAADVYLPREASAPVPAIVSLNTGYDKSAPAQVAEARFYVEQGFAYVVNDARGRGKSEGVCPDTHAWGLGADGYAVIEWVAAQPWCNRRVGSTGGSWLGGSQIAAAAQHPPHLACIAPGVAGGLFLRETAYDHGVFPLGTRATWTAATRGRLYWDTSRIDWEHAFWELPLRRILDHIGPNPWFADYLEHDTLDDWWRQRLVDGWRERLEVPALHIAGWFDHGNRRGTLRGYEEARCAPAGDRQWLIVGPWPHAGHAHPTRTYAGVDFGPDAALDLQGIKLRFYDHWLRDADNGWLAEPRVRLFETGTNRWLTADSWPLPSHVESLYLTGDGQLSLAAPGRSDAPRTFQYDPRQPVVPVDLASGASVATALRAAPIDQGYLVGRPDVLIYTSPPLQTTVAVSGRGQVELYASSDCDDTEWHVRLADVHPDGQSIEIAAACLRAAYHDSLSSPTPLEPGRVYCFTLELSPLTHAFLPGHRIRFTLTSSHFPVYARSLNRFGRYRDIADARVATNSVHHGPRAPSRVALPVSDGSLREALS
jgi:putative CocE/NonD family hydrolase